MFQGSIKLPKNAPCEKVQILHQSHTVSVAIKLDQIQILKNEGYLILSQTFSYSIIILSRFGHA